MKSIPKYYLQYSLPATRIMIRYILSFSVAVLFLLVGSRPVQAQASIEETEYKIHSIYIHNFIKYIQWPDEYNSGDFIIGVLGETDLDQELQKMAGFKSAISRNVVVQKFSDVSKITTKCHILFITSGSSQLLGKVLQKLSGKPTLIITNKDGLCRAGSSINFVSENGKPRFEMNTNAIERNKLKCAQQLKSYAIVI